MICRTWFSCFHVCPDCLIRSIYCWEIYWNLRPFDRGFFLIEQKIYKFGENWFSFIEIVKKLETFHPNLIRFRLICVGLDPLFLLRKTVMSNWKTENVIWGLICLHKQNYSPAKFYAWFFKFHFDFILFQSCFYSIFSPCFYLNQSLYILLKLILVPEIVKSWK